jgi:hypothetical protein
MKLYVKKVAPEWVGVFKVGDEITVDDTVGIQLVGMGLATASNPKAKSNDKTGKAGKGKRAADA